MSIRIYDKIRKALETTPGLTQKGLAERMGLNPAAVNRMLYGRRNIMAEEIPIIEDYLGIHLSLSTPQPHSPAPSIKYSQDNRPSAVRNAAPLTAPQNLPVYGDAVQKTVIDWVVRHPALLDMENAFALYVADESMTPRYFKGEVIYLHPHKAPEVNQDCLMILKDGSVLLRRLLLKTAEIVTVTQFNPPQQQQIATTDIQSLYLVVGRG
jgi:phage repressor protein C with HTH and peptisase S24 domain